MDPAEHTKNAGSRELNVADLQECSNSLLK